MSTVTNIQPRVDKRETQRVRAAFVRAQITADDRSDRYVARQIGVAPSTMSERLNGNTAFHPDDLAIIARILKRAPGEFFEAYLNASDQGGDEAPVSEVKSRHFTGELIDIFTGRQIEAVA